MLPPATYNGHSCSGLKEQKGTRVREHKALKMNAGVMIQHRILQLEHLRRFAAFCSGRRENLKNQPKKAKQFGCERLPAPW